MNERIQELAEQAAFRQFTMPKANFSSDLEGYNGMFTEQEAIEKFAELLIRECANIDFRSKVGMTRDQEFETGCVILEHFEVEE